MKPNSTDFELRNKLLELLKARFTYVDLQKICAQLAPRYGFADFPGEGADAKLLAFLEHLRTRGALDKLTKYIEENRSDIDLAEYSIVPSADLEEEPLPPTGPGGSVNPVRRFLFPTVSITVVLALIVYLLIQSGMLSLNRAETIVLQEEPYHIGDVEHKSIFQNGTLVGIIPYAHPSPQQNPFEAEFNLRSIPSEAILHLTARDVDPDEKSSPVKIHINGHHVGYLNKEFYEETMEPRSVSIEIDPIYLQRGTNTLLIFVEPSGLEYGVQNLDDIEFWDVRLEFS